MGLVEHEIVEMMKSMVSSFHMYRTAHKRKENEQVYMTELKRGTNDNRSSMYCIHIV